MSGDQVGALVIMGVFGAILTLIGGVFVGTQLDKNDRCNGIIMLCIGIPHLLPPLFFVWTKAIGG